MKNEISEDVKLILENTFQVNDELHIDLWYPRNRGISKMVIGLMDVRAADSVRISYDFDRDGWTIEQASTFRWSADDKECDWDWQEVAFVQAWAREKWECNHCSVLSDHDAMKCSGCGRERSDVDNEWGAGPP